jgi:hypothetical protein
MRRSRERAARLVVRIVDGADHTLLEARGTSIGWRRFAEHEAPGRLSQGLRPGASHGSPAYRSGHHDAAAEQRTTVKQAVSPHFKDRISVLS